MRKILLNMNEENKYRTIKKLVETNGNKLRASKKLGVTIRHINRMIQGYKNKGKYYFKHGNAGRKPAHTLSKECIKTIINFYKQLNYKLNFKHFCEVLETAKKIKVSPSTVKKIMKQNHIVSPLALKRTKRAELKYTRELEKQKRLSLKEKKSLREKSLLLEDLRVHHPTKPRVENKGELIQMDASVYKWFDNKKTYLHIAVDDATGELVGAYFDTQETLKGYYNVLHQILTNYGIPYQFLTDNRTVFKYKGIKNPSLSKDTPTQFGYACKQLGIDIKTTSIPEKKGRVEKMNHTLQHRLPGVLNNPELSPINRKIKTIEEANAALKVFIKDFNNLFRLHIDDTKNVFEKQPKSEDINLCLSVIEKRKIDNGNAISYKNNYYRPINEKGESKYYNKGEKVLVIKAFDGTLYANIKDRIHLLEKIPLRAKKSPEFNFLKKKKKRKLYIPPITHPWKRASFEKYLRKQKHRKKQGE